jgi:EAL and modified HD-GYP domain-containing signal transduction protein
MVAVPSPLVEVRAVANGQNEWVALLLDAAEPGLDGPALQALFGTPDLLTAIAPLDCIVPLDSLAILTPPLLHGLPPHRVLLAVRAGALAQEGARQRLAALQAGGYRVLVDDAAHVPGGHMLVHDCRGAAMLPTALPATLSAALSACCGPHLADGVDTMACFAACIQAGFGWFAGDYPLDSPLADGDDGSTARRLLTMLALLARDADSRALETQLRQDAALSYHLLKLVNSAAFSAGTPITSFGQAISRLGRRQLQRWLQLLLYARPHPDAPPNLMLPLAARRGAMLEALCKHDGCDNDAQDLAFMTGAFSLLDRLFQMPMAAIVRDLNLPAHVEVALLHRAGELGARLRLVEAGAPDPEALRAAGIGAQAWWQSQLHAWHWAIQVARNV